MEKSYFDGNGGELFGWMLLMCLVSMLTCGLAAPCIMVKIYEWRINHTVINGHRLKFNGTTGELFGVYIVNYLLTIVTCGIYAFFAGAKIREWEAKHTYIDGEPLSDSFFDGTMVDWAGYTFVMSLINSATCGIATPWGICMFCKWALGKQVVNGRRLSFDGEGGEFFGDYIIILLLSMITCGIYSAWGTVKINKFIYSHTNFQEDIA